MAVGTDHYYQNDVPLAPDEDEMYDDAPRKRRHGGLATALALIGCAMLGTAGAYAYRSYLWQSQLHAAAAGDHRRQHDPDQDRPRCGRRPAVQQGRPGSGGNAGREQIVTKQEEPVALKDLGTQAAPRVVLPAPVAPVQADHRRRRRRGRIGCARRRLW